MRSLAYTEERRIAEFMKRKEEKLQAKRAKARQVEEDIERRILEAKKATQDKEMRLKMSTIQTKIDANINDNSPESIKQRLEDEIRLKQQKLAELSEIARQEKIEAEKRLAELRIQEEYDKKLAKEISDLKMLNDELSQQLKQVS